MKKKILLSILFIISLIPSVFSQYGGMRGVQEISGIINITNPIGILAILLYFIGVWINFKNKKIKNYFPYIGMCGMVISELNNFLTWNYPNTSYIEGIKHCFDMVFPMFYVGVIISIVFLVVYTVINKKMKD